MRAPQKIRLQFWGYQRIIRKMTQDVLQAPTNQQNKANVVFFVFYTLFIMLFNWGGGGLLFRLQHPNCTCTSFLFL